MLSSVVIAAVATMTALRAEATTSVDDAVVDRQERGTVTPIR